MAGFRSSWAVHTLILVSWRMSGNEVAGEQSVREVPPVEPHPYTLPVPIRIKCVCVSCHMFVTVTYLALSHQI